MSDPFEIFGVEPGFDLDLGELERRHRDLSAMLHPDRFTGKPAAERRQALSKAIEVNEAWRILRDPIRRAEALLERRGVAVGETAEPKPDPELLMDMMEKREALAEVRQSKDEAALAKLTAEVGGRQGAVLSRLGERLAAADHAAAVGLLGELRYLRRFLDEAGTIEDELF